MRDAVKIIYRAVERIDDPLMFACLVADDSFFAVERMIREFLQKRFRDEVLRLNVDGEFDVVGESGVDPAWPAEIVAEQLARSARRFLCCIGVVSHFG